MNKEFEELSDDLKGTIKRMKKIQKKIAGDGQPASMHEIDELKDLGDKYAGIVTKIAALESESKRNS